MPIRSRLLFLLATVFLAPFVLAGCGSDKPTRLYVLSATTEQPATMSPQGISVGVGPITLPKYLDRPQIVLGVSVNQLSQANFDQWGGDLNDNVTRVLATNLSNLLGTERVSLYPWKDRPPTDIQVTMDVSKFETEADGTKGSATCRSSENAGRRRGRLLRNGRRHCRIKATLLRRPAAAFVLVFVLLGRCLTFGWIDNHLLSHCGPTHDRQQHKGQRPYPKPHAKTPVNGSRPPDHDANLIPPRR